MIDVQVTELPSQPAAVVRGAVPMAELPAFFQKAFGAVIAVAEQQGVEITGPPFGYYPSMPADVVEVAAGFPTARMVEPADGVEPLELPAATAAVTVHVGPFDQLARTYGELEAWMRERGRHGTFPMWERYLSDPHTEPDPATWRTEIVWPVA